MPEFLFNSFSLSIFSDLSDLTGDSFFSNLSDFLGDVIVLVSVGGSLSGDLILTSFFLGVSFRDKSFREDELPSF